MTLPHSPIYVAVDVETTGLRSMADRVVEVAAVRFTRDGDVLVRYSSLVNPGIPIPPEATKIHGITDAMVAGAPSPIAMLRDLGDFLGHGGNTVMVAHNALFDREFLLAAFMRCGLAVPMMLLHPIDTMKRARQRWPGLGAYNLGALARARGYDTGELHRAAADAERVRRLWVDLQDEGERVPQERSVSATDAFMDSFWG